MGTRLNALKSPPRINPYLADGALALTLFALVQAQSVTPQQADPLSAAIVAFETFPLTFRRRSPALVLSAVGVALVAHLAAGYHNGFFDTFSGVVALYTVAAQRPRRVSAPFLAILPVALVAAIAVDWHNQGHVNLFDIPYNLLLFLSAWILGDSTQTRRAYALELEQRDAALTRESQARARATLAEERTLIARELHDIVAHSVSIMVLQANAGERIIRARPEDAAVNLANIQTTGREALAELRRLLSVLREPDGIDATRNPQPGMSDVARLAEQARNAGLDTTLTVEGDASMLSDALQLSAYRVIQEALTNTLRHARASQAVISIRCAARSLEVEVVDDGCGAEGSDAQAGHGLIGMRERTQAFAGELQAGPLQDQGFRVMARFVVDGVPL